MQDCLYVLQDIEDIENQHENACFLKMTWLSTFLPPRPPLKYSRAPKRDVLTSEKHKNDSKQLFPLQ